MKKKTHHIPLLSCFTFSFILILASMIGISVNAATPSCQIYEGENIEAQNYSIYSNPISSYLVPASNNTFMRVQAKTDASGIVVEYYDYQYNLLLF